jgi:hypothetical protein
MAGELIIYQNDDGTIRLETRLEDETLWLTQQQMAELFLASKQNISHHIRNIYDEGELTREATVKNYLTVQREGKREVKRNIEYYNIDMIISVGYRVKSLLATRFRIWATQHRRMKKRKLNLNNLKPRGGKVRKTQGQSIGCSNWRRRRITSRQHD